MAWLHQRGEHISEASLTVETAVRDVWELFVLLGLALLHRDFCGTCSVKPT